MNKKQKDKLIKFRAKNMLIPLDKEGKRSCKLSPPCFESEYHDYLEGRPFMSGHRDITVPDVCRKCGYTINVSYFIEVPNYTDDATTFNGKEVYLYSSIEEMEQLLDE